MSEKLTKHDWMFDGRVMFCRRCFQKTAAPGRIGSEMDTECPGFGEVRIKPLLPSPTKGGEGE